MTAPQFQTSNQAVPPLPAVGMSRWETIRHFVPISRESWRKLVNAGLAPKPIRLSQRCTMYSNSDVHRWLADPANYSPPKELGSG